MAFIVPRVTLRISVGDEHAFGEFGAISLGYGLHQAWVYATMFATHTLFNSDLTNLGTFGETISFTSFLSMIIFGICLVIASIVDQKVAPFMQKRSTVIAGALLMCIGTLIMLLPDGAPTSITAQDVVPAILTGIGSAILILAWGCRFARVDVLGIALNTAAAIPLGFVIYAAILVALPYPVGGIVTAALPLLELCVLLHDRKAYGVSPIGDRVFRPLPLTKGAFFWRFGVPVFIFGLALGVMRRNSVQSALIGQNPYSQSVLIAAAGLAFILFLLIIIFNAQNSSIRRYFRILVPVIALAILMIPALSDGEDQLQIMLVTTVYMCFEALMWAFFGEISQRFRISPILTFGCGRGLLALASALGGFLTSRVMGLIDTLPFGDESVLIIMLVIMVCAYAVLPSDNEIAHMVKPADTVDAAGVKIDAVVDPMTEADTSITTIQNDRFDDESPIVAEIEAESKPEPTTNAQAQVQEQGPANAPVASAPNPTSTAAPSPIEPNAATPIPAHQALTKEEEATAREHANKGWFRARCEKVANTYLLSERESEVMFYLAKGYNAAYIQEKLYISEGTAKTHMRHIYRKLDIHSQQELMRMVENAEVERPIYR